MKKKLIEVALPLEAINKESAHEKSVPRRGHPATLHLWWARRPLAACRAVLFASLVDDPSSHPDKFPTEEDQEAERQRLFRIIEELVKWENINNERVLKQAREEILKSTDGNPPPVYDPFCGGGSIPLEAQRLGLEAHGSDLNPVPVLITKALIEIPPKFANSPPVNPDARNKIGHKEGWRGAEGLAEDVRYYGKWMKDEAEKRIGHLYPKVKLSIEHGGGAATVIAWLWTRTVKCPNPACGCLMPLVRSFALSTKKGKQAWIEPVIDRNATTPIVKFDVKTGSGAMPEGTVNRKGARCICCHTPVPLEHVRSEGKAGRMTSRLMAIVAEGPKSRIYVRPIDEHTDIAERVKPSWIPHGDLPLKHRNFQTPGYGLGNMGDLFTSRQLVALTKLSDLIGEARENVLADGGSIAYADAVATYLAFALDKLADWSSAICSWIHSIQGVRDTFARQAIPMVWDFVEINPLSNSVGNFLNHTEWVADSIKGTCSDGQYGFVMQSDATANNKAKGMLISTDPPYYDNICYADLSDFFYVWLRRTLGNIYPDLFSTVLVPKTEELVATPNRFDGNRQRAQEFFETGLSKAFAVMRHIQHQDYPLTVYYAFKQSEADEEIEEDSQSAVASTGWETMLEGLLKAGFQITGTWPMRSERSARSVAIGTNALASSIVLVCRPRLETAAMTTRRDFISTLKKELPDALRKLQQGNIAPVDLAQAAIGPGMAVFSRYSKVIEADGSPMKVRTALALINQALDEVLVEQEGEFDSDTRWAVAWFDQFGMNEGPYGVAETLSKAKNTSVEALAQDGFLTAKAGKVRLLNRDELQADWDPATDRRLTVWEITHYLIRALEQHGEQGAATLLSKVGDLGEIARDLAYRLYVICERKGWAQEGLVYNSIVISWPEITRLASHARPEEQLGLV
jgi:putative DNA methylase